MRKWIIIMISIIIVFSTTACTKNKNETKSTETQKEGEKMSSISITIENEKYQLNLEDNETAKEFLKRLPKEFSMNELNGNEKYHYLDKSLPVNAKKPDKIKKGDVMLFGDNCLVVFYKTFQTSYSYTKIGHIEDLKDLGNDDVKVRFEQE